MILSGLRDWSMRISSVFTFLILLGLVACKQKGKSEVAELLGIEEPMDWLLVIHPEGCKTCLESLYDDLALLTPNADAAIVILAKNSKNLRMIPLIQESPIPLHLDENKVLIEKGILELQDQILLFKDGSVEKFDILNYEKVFHSIASYK
jgi:hypothetical protein